MNKIKKPLALLLSLLMLMTAMPLAAIPAFAAENVTYVDRTWDTTNKKVVEETKTASAEPIESSTTSITLADGWYYVDSTVTVSGAITVSGIPEEPTYIILKDNALLTVTSGIKVASDNALVIYAQAGDSGAINTSSGGQNAGIGGGARAACGTVIIKGGKVSAKGGASGGAGIGGGFAGGGGGTVTVYGGTVEAMGRKYSAGIGGGGSTSSGGAGGTVTVYGGTVFAAGNGYGAGIGGAKGGAGGTVTVYDGRVDATGGNNAAGIGGGYSGDGGTVTVEGGKVTAMGGGEGAGIGGGYSGKGGTLTISGGEVFATGGDNGAGIGNIGANEGTVTFTGGTVVATGVNRKPGIAGAIIADYDVMKAGSTAPGTEITLNEYLDSTSKADYYEYVSIHKHEFVNNECACGATAHTHDYTDSYVNNNDGTHSGKCECGEVSTEKVAHTYDAAGTCVCGAKVTPLYKNYLIEGKEPIANGANGYYNRYSYYLGENGTQNVLNNAVYNPDKEVSFEAWYLRTMVQYKPAGDGKLDIRFVTMLDENLDKYEEAGFNYTVDGESGKLTTKVGYTSFIADGKTTYISEYSQEDDYFVLQNTVFAKEVVALDPEITVTPYVKLMDGTVLEGKTVTFHITDFYE